MENRGIEGMMGKLGSIAKTVGVKELPAIPEKPFEDMFKGTSIPKGKKRGRVAYYVGCATNSIYPETGEAVMKVLFENGIEVVIPDGLVCCGIPALGEGDLKTAREMMQKTFKSSRSSTSMQS